LDETIRQLYLKTACNGCLLLYGANYVAADRYITEALPTWASGAFCFCFGVFVFYDKVTYSAINFFVFLCKVFVFVGWPFALMPAKR
jgi:hypothetical protein